MSNTQFDQQLEKAMNISSAINLSLQKVFYLQKQIVLLKKIFSRVKDNQEKLQKKKVVLSFIDENGTYQDFQIAASNNEQQFFAKAAAEALAEQINYELEYARSRVEHDCCIMHYKLDMDNLEQYEQELLKEEENNRLPF